MAGNLKIRIGYFFLVYFVFLCGCTDIYTAKGLYHRLQKGESLGDLAERYHLPLQELAEINDIQDISSIKEGRSIFIPGVKARSFALLKRSKRRGGARPADKIQLYHGKFAWPIHGSISSGFGVRRGRRHDGIDIRAPRGTPIQAAEAGEVAFSDRLKGYGNLVLLKHSGNFYTVYAHNSVNLVKKGNRVKKGQVIAKVGRTGRATGPHLHFEVREGERSRNPLFFLPEKK